MSSAPRFRFLVCDLDDTLYPTSAGIMPAVGRLINRYMIERVGIPPDEAKVLRRLYFNRYGTTMRGLIVNYGIDPEDYLTFVHDLPLEEYIRPNPALDAMLGGIPLRKVVFTNASREHANRVMGILGVGRHFERIVDVRDFGYFSKPNPEAYQTILDILDARPAECIMVEDAVRNLAPARALGMTVVLVDGGAPPLDCASGDVDVCIADILGLAEALRPLLAAGVSG
jgi:putative hydrolase of the HAD superfamily